MQASFASVSGRRWLQRPVHDIELDRREREGVMALNFPSSPATNDTHVANGLTYRWNGAVWNWEGAPTTALRRNYLINPSMQISQENGRNQFSQGFGYAGGTTANYFMADQWAAVWQDAGVQGGSYRLWALSTAGTGYAILRIGSDPGLSP